jgi:multisubunit Na+/H+ antiporter MnhB subunit
MATRLGGICLTAVLIFAILATPAAGQSSQVSQYVQADAPTTGGFDPGQTGDLPFTGLTVLPLLIVGILVALGGLALRRRLR